MFKKLIATLLVVLLGTFTISYASAIPTNTESFSSPLSVKSFSETGKINSKVNIKAISQNVDKSQTSVAYNSMGCSSSCSSGCSYSCSNSCSNSCSMRCGSPY